MRAVVFTGAGGPEVMSLKERPDPRPGSQEVLVHTSFAALNPADFLQRAGQYPPPPGAPADVPGLEVAGTVVACGDETFAWKEGDRVFGIVGGGGLADVVVAHERHLARIPENLGDEEAAAVPEVFVTAHDAVFSQAGLRMGETLLVNGANGGVGTAAVQLGVAAGARVLASLRAEAARDRVAELGAEVCTPDDLVARARERGGANVVLELVGAPNFLADMEALAPQGRIVVVGTGAGADAPLSLHTLMTKRARLLGTVLRGRSLEEKAVAVQAFSREVVPLLARGRVRPVVDRVFPARNLVEAFDYLVRPGKFGKILIAF
jgi:putative PIG3 family NAD(P)H quinone oxidoreductase